MQPQTTAAARTHILTIAFEDYFHGPALSKVVSKNRWDRFESRCERNTQTVLDQLAAAGSHATFFATTWMAQHLSEVLQEVIRRGHEVALAGQRGVSFRLLTPNRLRDQVRRDREILEQACGTQVVGFRVTDVLLQPRHLWALTVLAEEGFRYDSSVSPFLRAFADEPWRRFLHRIDEGKQSFYEVPLASESLAGFMLPVAGGNYFRQFPDWLVRRMLSRASVKAEHPMVLYFRLWDFDPMQPRVQTGSLWRDVRHYRNGDRILKTLAYVLSAFRFNSIAGHLELKLLPVAAATSKQMPAHCTGFATDRTPVPISIIVPCFNEQDTIYYLSKNLQQLQVDLAGEYDPEFVLVDDGSSDGTWSRLNEVFGSWRNVQLIRHAANRGVSAAILTGLQSSREIACSMDCDCSYDPAELKPMLRLLAEGVDLVTASPYHPSGCVLNVPRWRLFLSRVSSGLYRLATNANLHTFTSCMRVYRRSRILAVPVQNPGFLGVAELVSRCALRKMRIVEHPATLEVRLFGYSKMKVMRTTLGHLRLLRELATIRLGNRRTPPIAPEFSEQSQNASRITSEVHL